MNKLLEFVLPRRLEYTIVKELSKDGVRSLYTCTKVGNTAYSLSNFSNPTIRALIHEAKFHNNEKAWGLLAVLLELFLEKQKDNYLLIPIPLAKKRHSERGYNQVTEIIKRITKTNERHELRTDILYRIKNTKPQTSLAKKDRLQNVANAFGIRHQKSSMLKGAKIILIDDVTTTGATMKAAEAKLRQHAPSSIISLSLAH